MSLEISNPAVLERERPASSESQMSETEFKSEFLQTMQARGFIHQITHPGELDAACLGGPIRAYIGFDATAAA